MKNDKDIIAVVKPRRDVMSVEERLSEPPKSRKDVILVEERMPTPPKSRRDVILVEERRDVIWVETPTVIRVILRYGLTLGFVQYPYHVPKGLRKGEEMLFYPHYIPDRIDYQGYYANLSSVGTKQSPKNKITSLVYIEECIEE